MRAVTYRSYGAARQVLTIENIECPSPGPGEVCVDLAYSGVNPSDVKARAGARGGPMTDAVVIPHSDGAGVISAIGDGVPATRIGQRVWIWNGQWRRAFGTAATRITLPADQAVPLPDDVDMKTGACLGIPGLTACFTVFCNGPVRGKTVLVQGGAGTVGLLAVQLARWGGARVIATARGDGMSRARAAGAETVIDYTAPDIASRILAANDGALIDHIVEVEFGMNAQTDTEVIAENGHIAAYGSVRNKTPELPFYPLMFKAVTLQMALIYLLTPQQRETTIATLMSALDEGALTCPIAHVFPLAECAAAHEAVEAGARTGAVLVRCGADDPMSP